MEGDRLFFVMRIHGNRRLDTLPGRDTRPTTGRVRKAVFDVWQFRIANCRWLDLCAGSGSMGAEALCRGAAAAVAIEQSRRACAVIRRNWERLAPSESFEIYCRDVRRRLPELRGNRFDCIYFDPPYASPLYAPVLELLASGDLLAPDGECAVEYAPQQWTPIVPPGWDLCRHKTYGNTAVAFYAPVATARDRPI